MSDKLVESEWQPLGYLTRTQVKLLGDLAEGLSMKEIASKHGVTFNTVHAHLQGAYKRLQARGGKHAIARAVRAGLI